MFLLFSFPPLTVVMSLFQLCFIHYLVSVCYLSCTLRPVTVVFATMSLLRFWNLIHRSIGPIKINWAKDHLLSLRQDGCPLEHYVEEFVEFSHLVSWSDIMLASRWDSIFCLLAIICPWLSLLISSSGLMVPISLLKLRKIRTTNPPWSPVPPTQPRSTTLPPLGTYAVSEI